MKYYSLLFFLALVFAGFMPTDAGEKDDIIELKAIALSEELAETLREFHDLKVYEIDEENVLRTSADYKIAYVQEAKQFLLATVITEQAIEQTTDNYEVIELGGGTKAHCYCESGNDDCTFQPSSDNGPGRNDFKCAGSCSCGIAITMSPTKDIHTVQSANGNWSPAKDIY